MFVLFVFKFGIGLIFFFIFFAFCFPETSECRQDDCLPSLPLLLQEDEW